MAYFASLNPGALLKSVPGGLSQGLIWGILALGVFITFRMLDVADLTVDGSMATGGAVTIMMVRAMPENVMLWFTGLGLNDTQALIIWSLLALLVACAAGALAGLATGLLHTMLGIPSILAGILTQISLYSINLAIMGKANQSVNVNKVSFLFTSKTSVIWSTILYLAIVCTLLVTVIYFYLGTEHGSALRATGINRAMARAQGINTNNKTVFGLVLSNALVALCGGIISQYQGFADVNMGRGAIVIGLAAVIIGEVMAAAIIGKRVNFYLRLVFVVIGSIIYYLVYVFVIWLKLPSDYMKLLTAVVVALFLAVPNLQAARKSSFRRVVKQNAKEAE